MISRHALDYIKEMIDYSEFQNWCDQETKVILKQLGVDNYKVRWVGRLDVDSDARFETEVMYPYQFSKAKFSHKAYEEWLVNPEETKSCLVHEVFHIILGPLANRAVDRYASEETIADAEEEVVDRLTNIFEKHLR